MFGTKSIYFRTISPRNDVSLRNYFYNYSLNNNNNNYNNISVTLPLCVVTLSTGAVKCTVATFPGPTLDKAWMRTK